MAHTTAEQRAGLMDDLLVVSMVVKTADGLVVDLVEHSADQLADD